jgi:uncharacterized membrane protein YphA (DoxX/SURF4 family)
MDLVARLLIVSFFVVNSSYSLITAMKRGIKLTKETDNRFKTTFLKISCYITFMATLLCCIAIVLNAGIYKDIAASYLIFILVLSMFKHANFWKSDGETRINKLMRVNKLMMFTTNSSLCGGLLLLIIRSQ